MARSLFLEFLQRTLQTFGSLLKMQKNEKKIAKEVIDFASFLTICRGHGYRRVIVARE